MNESEMRSLYDRLDKIEESIEAVTALLNKLQGAGSFVKMCFLIGAPFAGFVLWAKDHIKW